MDMVGDENDDQRSVMVFQCLEQHHILIEILDGADDHLRLLEIQFLEEIDVADISVDAWDPLLLQMRDDAWMLIHHEDAFVRLMERRIDIASEPSVSEQRYLIVLLIDLLRFLVPHSWQQRKHRLEEMIDLLAVDDGIARSCYRDEPYQGDHGEDVRIFQVSGSHSHGHEEE